jgi:hypothetical protein
LRVCEASRSYPVDLWVCEALVTQELGCEFEGVRSLDFTILLGADLRVCEANSETTYTQALFCLGGDLRVCEA